jgi:hypothetical protein
MDAVAGGDEAACAAASIKAIGMFFLQRCIIHIIHSRRATQGGGA